MPFCPCSVNRGNGINGINGINVETRVFTVLAVACGDAVQLADPESLWWQELRVLLKYRRSVADELLDAWAGRLALITRAGHRIPAHSIRRWMRTWKSDLTVEDVLNFRESDT